jgi:hypothetical protein
MRNPENSTGFAARIEQGCVQPAAPPRRPPGAAWITDEAIADTQRVWSPYYRRPLNDAEAIEILMNVRHLAEVLVQAKRKR